MHVKTQLILLFLFSTLIGQVKIGDWRAYTSPLKINETIISGDSIICATEGGLLIKSGDSYKTLTTIDGLYSVDLSTIEKDRFGNLWVGGNTPLGYIQIYNFSIGSVEVFDFGLTKITDIYIDSENAYATFVDGQDVGIVKFVHSNDKWSYRDIYRNFPVAIDEINGLEILQTTLGVEKHIFLATNAGLFLGDISTNLKDPNNWQRGFCCFDDGPIKAMTRYQDGIAFIFDEDGNDPAKVYYMYPSGEFYSYEDLDITIPVLFEEMIFDNDSYLVGIKNKIVYSQKNAFYPLIQQVGLNSLMLGLDQEIIIGSNLGLKLLQPNMEILSFIPNSPASSKFTALKVLRDGRLVGASSNGLSIKDFAAVASIMRPAR